MSKILIVGDPHIGKGASLGRQFVGSSLNSRFIDQIQLLDWVYDQSINNSVKHIILTGDIFDDPKPPYNLVVLFLDWLKKCSDYDISVHLIAGNHDILRSGQFITSPLDIISSSDIPNIFVYKRINTLHLEDVGITFLPFRDRRSFNTDSNKEALLFLKNQLPYEAVSIDNNCIKILVGHLALEGAIPVGTELDELSNELFCPLNMFKGYDYVWMGHIHKFQIMSETPHIAHLGSLDISDFGEADHNKYLVLIDTSQDVKFSYIKVPTRSLKHITINLSDTNSNVNEIIIDELKKCEDLNNSIVKVSIVLSNNSSHRVDRSLVENTLHQMGVFHITRISEEKQFVSLKKNFNQDIDNTINEVSAIKTYSSLVDENMREEFINLALSVIQEYKENN